MNRKLTGIVLGAVLTAMLAVATGCQDPHYRQARQQRDTNMQTVLDMYERREALSGGHLSDLDRYVIERRIHHARRRGEMDAYLQSETQRRDRQWSERQPFYRRWFNDLFGGDPDNARRTRDEILD